ncbi:Golgi-associated kinase 1A [Embiotoca jacksoni]|uniref:Golgi-associated kinase 1A n=1 Tax=Embiotoca jacksoni TaxID=100190 RepID=UPI003704C641
MAWHLWSKLCCGQKWIVLLSPLFLLFLTISMTMITLPLSLPPADIDRRSSRALSSTGELGSRPRMVESPPAASLQQPLTQIHSSSGAETSKRSALPKPFVDIKEKSHGPIRRNRYKSKRKEMSGSIQPTSHHHPHMPESIVNNTDLTHRMKPSNHSAAAKHTAQTYIHTERSKYSAARMPAAAESIISDRRAAHRQAGRWEDRNTNRNASRKTQGSQISAKLIEPHKTMEKHRRATKHSGKSDNMCEEHQAMKKPQGDLKKHHDLSEDPSKAKKNPGSFEQRKASFKPKRVAKKDDSSWCQSFSEQDFPDTDHRRIRINAELQPLPWLSRDDIQKMELLAGGEVVSKARVPAHGRVLQVALDPLTHQQTSHHGAGSRRAATHSERCEQGHCSLVKRPEDWFEVFAFHLDRVLQLNRSLPTVLSTFHNDVLPYRYIDGSPRPAVWWDPDIQHLADVDNDQNSVPLSWVQYQKLLRARCGSEADQRSAPCVGVHHSEWGRLALFDFLLQVNDRLDRYCCGFTPDTTELCVENLLHAKCHNTKDLVLVHILVRKADPSRLVFIDNAGRPQQSTDNLNFRLIEGIDEFPEKAVSVLRSGCLEGLLLRSLYTDRNFWDSHGGADGLRPLIHIVEQRGNILLQHIGDKKLRLKRDL